MRDDQLRGRVRVEQTREVVGDWRQPAPAVDENRHAAFGGDREHRCEAVVVEQEFLRAGMELDAARTAVETTLRLLDRRLGQVEPDVGDQPSIRAFGCFQRPVVAGLEPWLPVGLVEAEDVGPRDVVAVHDREELLEAAHHPVDVVAEVRMRVEDVRPCRELGAELRLEAREELLCAFQGLAHPLNLPT